MELSSCRQSVCRDQSVAQGIVGYLLVPIHRAKIAEGTKIDNGSFSYLLPNSL